MLATSTALRSPTKPAWQTDELEEEWIEPSSDPPNSHARSRSDTDSPHRSLADPAPSPTHSLDHSPPSPTPVGTFLIREDQPAAPILPKPLGKARSKGLIKDFFSPLALETMFEPPSPRLAQGNLPAVPSRLAQVHTAGEDQSAQDESGALESDHGLGEGDMEETRPLQDGAAAEPEPEEEAPADDEEDAILASDIPNLASFNGRKPSASYKFTFAAPRAVNVPRPIPESTPKPPPPRAPATDPRLRLFQFQYDTFTREHLSAMIDSIAVHSSSSNVSKATPPPRRQPVSTPESESNAGYIRATKRLRLTPPQELSNGGASARPRRDYVGESRHLMQKIKQARTPSMMTTVPIRDIKENIEPTNVEDHSMVEDRPRRLPVGELRSAWSSNTPSELSSSIPGITYSHGTSSTLQPSAAYASSSLHPPSRTPSIPSSLRPEYPTSTLTPSIPSSLYSSTSNSHSKPASIASALGYRRQAADLMAQIRKDMTTGRRLVSLEVPAEDVAAEPARAAAASPRTDRDPGKPPPARKAPRPSPRKLLRRLSAADEVDRELALNKSASDVSQAPLDATHLPPPSPHVPAVQVFHMATPTLLQPPERVVSGGTTTSAATTDTALTHGTSATSVSVGSCVKHAGPVQMTRIAPGDVPGLPETVGAMRFDRTGMRWVKAALEESDDPFRSFESLEGGEGKGEEAGEAALGEGEPNGGEEVQGGAGEEVRDALREAKDDVADAGSDSDDSFEFDAGSAAAVVEVMTGVDSGDAETETETSDSDAGDAPHALSGDDDNDDDNDDATATFPAPAPVLATTPIPPHRTLPAPPRSALKSSPLRTPAPRAHPRSVSFSDGRRDGKIAGASPFAPSTRGRRIAAVLADLADEDEETTPSKTGARGRGGAALALARTVVGDADQSLADADADLSLAAGRTFLTECSFGVAQEKLVHALTDAHPYVPHWDALAALDLRGAGVESVARLKEFLPRLDALQLDGNKLPWLTGVPASVRTLSVSSNMLTALTSFNHLRNVEHLDLSNNQLDSLTQLACLHRLRELTADGNAIASLDGLGALTGLTKLSLRGNRLAAADVGAQQWPRLEVLDLSRNRLRSVAGLASLPALTALNLDHNRLESLDAGGAMAQLRTLRVSDNRLADLDVSTCTGLRTLYADDNCLCDVRGLQRLRKLENLSLRNQGGAAGLTLATRDIRDVKRLYLSGNPLVSSFIEEPCYNLVYLELAACRLAGLPRDLGRLVPNVRVLNLNYNVLTDARGLEGLTRLRKLTVVGAQLAGTRTLVRALRRMPELEMLDCRMNPCTLGWYPPILGPGAGAGAGAEWEALDARFRRGLPDAAYVGRLAYRGLVMRACARMRLLDGVAVGPREREKAARLLAGLGGGA